MTTNYYIIPCSGDKLRGVTTKARELYTGQMFRNTLTAVLANCKADEAAGDKTRILILSAKHGLLDLDDLVTSYDCRMGGKDEVTNAMLSEQAERFGMLAEDAEVYCLLPRAYLVRLDTVLRQQDVYAHDVYEAAPGVGYQRQVNRHISRP